MVLQQSQFDLSAVGIQFFLKIIFAFDLTIFCNNGIQGLF